MTGLLIRALAVAVTVAACGTSTSPAGVSVAPATRWGAAGGTREPGQPLSARPTLPVHWLPARQAPASWYRAALPGGAAVLAFPPSMHLVGGDQGTVTAASFSPSGAYLTYLNATPKQGAESLRDWPAFRVSHQRAEDAAAVRLLAVWRAVRFIGGTGTCVIDAYVTKVRANRYTEIACFVQGATSASVIVAAAPTASWPSAAGLLARAVAAYQVR